MAREDVDDDALLDRFDAHLARFDDPGTQHPRLERNPQAFERNTQAFERNTQAFDRNTRAWGKMVAALTAIAESINDMREDIKANTQVSSPELIIPPFKVPLTA